MTSAGGTYASAMVVLVALAALHAWTKLSPRFARRWFGSAVLFGATWTLAGRLELPTGDVLALIVPAFVFYVAAAVTKGLVESTDALAGRHVVHVVMTALFAVAIAWPHERLWRERAWFPTSSEVSIALAWGAAAFVFYGTYKLVDHSTWSQNTQRVALAVAMPALGAALGMWVGV